MARSFLSDVLEKHTANTHNKYLTLLSSIWSNIKKKDDESTDEYALGSVISDQTKANLTINPFEGIEKEEVVMHPHRALTVEELRRLYDTATGSLRLAFAIGMMTALRKKDVFLLDWKDVSLEQGFIRTRPFKVRRRLEQKDAWVYIPILPQLHKLLSLIPIEKRMGYVMPDLAQKYLESTSNVSYMVTKVFKDAGITTSVMGNKGRRCVEANYHSLRTSFITLGSSLNGQNGSPIPLTTLQAIAGHTSIGTTEKHYLNLSPQTLKEQMRSFPNLLSDDETVDIAEGA